MKYKLLFLSAIVILVSCTQSNKSIKEPPGSVSLNGTWKLLKGQLVEKNDTTVTDYTKGISFIKIINNDHFAFLEHDLNQGKDSTAVFVAGGGRYSLNDSTYTEHLEYCSDRSWEGHDFTFTIHLKNDTLIQTGVEKVDSLGINRLNTETYVKIKD